MENRRINKEMFDFVQMDKSIHDKKFDTKPIGYFKDAWIRFTKNKSSVVGGIIIIILLLFAIFAPIISKYNYTDKDSPKYTETDGNYSYAFPKSTVFSFLGWDGTNEKDLNPTDYYILKSKGYEESDDSVPTRDPLVKEIRTYTTDTGEERHVVKVDTYYNVGFKYINLKVGEYARLQAYQNKANIQVIYPISQYCDGYADANIWFTLTDDAMAKWVEADLSGEKGLSTGMNLLAALDEDGNLIPTYAGSKNEHYAKYFSLRIKGDDGTSTIRTVATKKVGTKYVIQRNEDGSLIYTETENQWYRYAKPNQTGYVVRVNYYEYYRYLKTNYSYNGEEAEWFEMNLKTSNDDFQAAMNKFDFDLESGFYPQFLFGAMNDGKDIFTQLGSGARLSFILAIAISAINLTIGAIYGAIEGYYGGATDMIMERISDILSGVPFIVVATLFKLHIADTVGPLVSLLFAFVLTGWIGMASRVRMQFYRFKNQEYILSARTLGAKDRRIMFKHIFPNAIGTIITGSILSIPGVIFSESSLSYLNIINLETSGFTSIGTMLSVASKSKFTDYPFIMFFPAIFISLLMISFNLFGNGLRDAFNPSLRGAEE